MAEYSSWEEMVDRYLEKGKKDAAIKLLFDLVSRYSKMKNFVKAEELRGKLFDVDPMALNEITKAAVIIEDEKNESIDHNHKLIWSELYNQLSTDEGNTLFFSMKEVVYDLDHVIYNQGQMNSNLYFINDGSLKTVYRRGQKEFLITTLKLGNIVGDDTFFSISACTNSLITLSKVNLHVLSRKASREWKEKCPTLESNLRNYFIKFKDVAAIIKENGLERRSCKRMSVSGMAQAQILNASKVPVGKPFRGEMVDLSSGGACFLIKASGHDSARLLLGRRVIVQFRLSESMQKNEFTQNAIVVGVEYRLFNDYSIHLRFEKELDGALGLWIENNKKPE